VEVVAEQCPGVNVGFGFEGDLPYAGQKIFAVPVVIDNVSSFDAPDDDMMQGARCVQARLPWHTVQALF
jgi:hypothetical protein